MEKGKVCCCVSGKAKAAKLQNLLQELGFEISNKDKKGGELSSKDTKNPIRDPYELNVGGEENPCTGVLCQPQAYVDPPDFRRKRIYLATLDGKAVCEGNEQPPPDIVWTDYNPRNPPGIRPRYASVELRGGVHHLKCSCGRRDGLRDDCPRWDCGGRPECLLDPWPDCCPHTTAHDYGVRPRNRIPPTAGHLSTGC